MNAMVCYDYTFRCISASAITQERKCYARLSLTYNNINWQAGWKKRYVNQKMYFNINFILFFFLFLRFSPMSFRLCCACIMSLECYFFFIFLWNPITIFLTRKQRSRERSRRSLIWRHFESFKYFPATIIGCLCVSGLLLLSSSVRFSKTSRMSQSLGQKTSIVDDFI